MRSFEITAALCTRCDTEGRPGDRFCGRCGAPLATHCPRCDAVVLAGAGCVNCGTAAAEIDAAEARPREERRVVTILFIDLVGYTALGERLDPEDLRALQHVYFDTVTQVIRRRGGVVEKYIGDAVMAVFGAPVAQEDDVVRAVRTGLELQAALEGRLPGPTGTLRARVGIATGEAVVDLDAMRDGGQSLVAGDVVNTAARLQQHAPTGGVVVSAATWRATDEHVEYAETPPISLKGKTVMLPVWQALRLVRRRWDDHPDRGPFVGRKTEFDLLRAALRKTVDERSPRLVCIAGVAGMGKSRLVREFSRHLDRSIRVGVQWVGGRCLPGAEGNVFAAIADMVTSHAGVLESDDAARARRKLRQSLTGMFAGPELARMTEALAPLVGFEDTPVEAREAEAAWRAFFGRLAERRPVVLVIEDLYLATTPLLRFLDGLLEHLAGKPLMVIGTVRPEFVASHADWLDQRDRDILRLPPLSDEETVRLFRELSTGPDVPQAALPTLTTLAAGTPLYAHEYVRMLADQHVLPIAPEQSFDTGLLSGIAGGLATGIDANGGADSELELPLPESLHAVVASRVDLLDARAQRALQAAAVLGDRFWPGAVAGIGELPRDEVERILVELTRRELVRPAAEQSLAGEPGLAFHHTVVRDLAYRRQPRAVRMIRHQRAAKWLGAHRADRTTDAVDAVAHHWVAALELATALSLDPEPFLRPTRTALVAAAERAAQVHALDIALGLLDRAIPLWPEDAALSADDEIAKLRALVRRWEARFLSGSHDFHVAGGPVELAACADRLAALGAQLDAGRAWTLLCQVERARADRNAALGHMERALAIFAALPDSADEAAAYAELARVHMMNYDAEAATAAARAADIARRLDRPELEMSALSTEGVAPPPGGDPEGLPLLERAVDRCRREQLRSLRRATTNLAVALQEEGEIGRSFALFDESASLAIGEAATAVLDYSDASMRAYFDGDWARTISAAEEYLDHGGDEDGSWEVLCLQVQTAWIRTLRGEPADIDLEACLAAARRGGFRLNAACVLAHGALCLALNGDIAGADEYLRQLADENTAEAFASREWLAAAAHAACLTSGERARWLRGVLGGVPRETLWVRAARSVVDGGIAAHEDQHGTASLHYAVAASVYERMGNATDAALAGAWAVRAARAAGDETSTRALAAKVDDFSRRNGAVLLQHPGLRPARRPPSAGRSQPQPPAPRSPSDPSRSTTPSTP